MKTIYFNGKVYTGELPLAEAFAVEGNEFVAAGTNEEICALKADGDEVVDLAGAFVCSGFNDSHMHLTGFGNALVTANLAIHTGSLEDLLGEMKRFAAEQ